MSGLGRVLSARQSIVTVHADIEIVARQRRPNFVRISEATLAIVARIDAREQESVEMYDPREAAR